MSRRFHRFSRMSVRALFSVYCRICLVRQVTQMSFGDRETGLSDDIHSSAYHLIGFPKWRLHLKIFRFRELSLYHTADVMGCHKKFPAQNAILTQSPFAGFNLDCELCRPRVIEDHHVVFFVL